MLNNKILPQEITIYTGITVLSNGIYFTFDMGHKQNDLNEEFTVKY